MTKRRNSLGFGFVPEETGYHFLVTVPPGKSEDIIISEHFVWEENEERKKLVLTLGSEDVKVKVILRRSRWDAIKQEVMGEFNRRLKEHGFPAGRWQTGHIPVSRLLGKELVLLAWAIEDADPALIPNAIKNWLGLTPEERWWLFTMTNAATGHAIYGRGKGWRKAVRYALTENPVSDNVPIPRESLLALMETGKEWHVDLPDKE